MEQSDDMVSNFIEKFSPHLFWDTDQSKLDWTKHRSYIVERVLEYGLFSDWQLLRSRLSVTEIAKQAKQFRQLDTKTLAFISAIQIPLKKNSDVTIPNNRTSHTGTFNRFTGLSPNLKIYDWQEEPLWLSRLGIVNP